MSLRQHTWTRVSALRQYPIDLAIVTLAAVGAYVAVSSLQDGSTLRLLVTMPYLLLLPGYALVSVLFPAAERDLQDASSIPTEQRPRGIDPIERLGLSVVLSVGTVVVIALVLPVTEWGLRTTPAAAGTSVVTIVFAQLGVVRRLQTPPPARFTVSPRATIRRLRDLRVASLLLVVAIGIAVGALALAVLFPAAAGGFTELGLYSETDDGELVAGELPDEVSPGESVPVTISIDNQEGDDRTYTIVVQQRTLVDGDLGDGVAIGELETAIEDGETETSEQEITPAAEAGDTVRISVLLYHDEPPAEPTTENADEDTFFWVSVSEE